MSASPKKLVSLKSVILTFLMNLFPVWGLASEIEIAPTKKPEPAPGRGIVQLISQHSGLHPALYALDEQPVEQMTPLISRQYLHGVQSTFVRWIVKKGAIVPLHSHPNEQITWITKGRADVYSGGQKYVMQAGDIMIIPPNVPHEFVFTEDTIDIDIFSPQRQDWIDGSANYIGAGAAQEHNPPSQ